MSNPKTHVISILAFPERTCCAAQRPKAFVAPVLESNPTNPPKRAQKRKIRIFHPSLSEPATTSERLTNAANGLPPATINVPERITKNSEMTTSLVMNAKAMVSTGGMRPHMPKFAINHTPFSCSAACVFSIREHTTPQSTSTVFSVQNV